MHNYTLSYLVVQNSEVRRKILPFFSFADRNSPATAAKKNAVGKYEIKRKRLAI